MWLLVGFIAITILSIYFSERLGEDHPLFNTFLFCIVCGFLLIPSLIIFLFLEHYDVVQEYKIFPITLPLFLMAGIALWATHGNKNEGSDVADNKNDITAEAIILTTVLSEDEKCDDSNNSNSNSSSSGGSSSSSSSSNSDDFFFL